MKEVSDSERDRLLKGFFESLGNSGVVVTASDVLKGVIRDYDLSMISSLSVPEQVVYAKMVSFTLHKIGRHLEGGLVDLLIEDYQKCHVSKKGKSNRVNKIIEAVTSVLKAEFELEKSGGMFRK